jgi:hypothetical protein
MPKRNITPILIERSLKNQLKDKSRSRREGLVRLAAPAAAPRAMRNESRDCDRSAR